MKKYALYFLCLTVVSASAAGIKHRNNGLKLFAANNSNIQYTGRIDFSDRFRARIWAPGVYIKARFKGPRCEILINDEVLGGNNHNYLEIVIDDKTPYRIQTTDKINVINVPEGLTDTEHTVLICKDTESNTGYIDFVGFRCAGLLPLPPKPKRKIEYFGDSQTTGAGMDLSLIPCGKGNWADQHNAYMTYGARTSRNLDAQWALSAVAGLGLVHSCCDMKVTMPQVYDKVFLVNNTINWDFKKYQPDVITVCLGQNDGAVDSALFCSTYIKLIDTLRKHCPKSDIICLTSPMGDEKLTAMLKRNLTAVTQYMNATGDKKVFKYYFSKQYYNGCGGHPDMDDHRKIANELTAYIKQLENW